MAGITVKSIKYGSWGNGVELSNGIVDVVATVDIGPRIIRFGFSGEDNMFKEDTGGLIFEKVRHEPEDEQQWNLYGGHRLWVSPEAMPRTYYPDNDPVAWMPTEHGVILTPPEEKRNRLQKSMEISMDPLSGEVTVIHRVTNTGPWSVEFAVWGLTVMARGGRAIIPQAKRDTGLLGNRILALWPYSKMNDSRVTWGEDFIQLRQETGDTPFKFGTNNEDGWAAYYNNNNLFVKYYTHLPEAAYPDFGVSFETYVNSHFLELETLGELKPVAPGETVSHTETWNLFRNVELSLDQESKLGQELKHYLKR